MYFERIGPQCPVLVLWQAPAAFHGLPPSVPWPPCPGGSLCTPTTLKPTETQVLRAHYRKPGAGPSGSLLGHAGLRGHPSHGGEAPRASGGLPVGEAGTRHLCMHRITGRPVPVSIGMPGPLPRLLAPGALVASWPSAPFPLGCRGEGGRRWEPAGKGQGPAEWEGVLGQGVWGSGGRFRVRWLQASLVWRVRAPHAQQRLVWTRALQGLAPSDRAPSRSCRRCAWLGRGQGPPSAGAEGAVGSERSPRDSGRANAAQRAAPPSSHILASFCWLHGHRPRPSTLLTRIAERVTSRLAGPAPLPSRGGSKLVPVALRPRPSLRSSPKCASV